MEEQPEGKELPKLFQPLKIRGMTIPNRIGVSPMCMYSAGKNFEATPFHLVHHGAFAMRGAGLIVLEATSVSEFGGLSPYDLAIYNDAQAKSLKPVTDFVHTQNGLIGVQIAHGGRKASGVPPFVHLEKVAEKSSGGWPDDVVAPSAIAYRPGGSYHTPKELTNAQVKQIVKDFGSAAKRAVQISGFDFVEIHAAHGYLLNSFMSAFSNKRTDEYGGSFENRIRIVREVIDSVRENVPKDFPVFMRISGSENTPDDAELWTIEDSVKLCKLLADEGKIDVIDVSSGGNNYKQNARGPRLAVHAPLAKQIKEAVGDKLLVACPGKIRSAELAEELLENKSIDIAMVGTGFLKNPGLALQWADDLGVKVHAARQYGWAFAPDRQQMVEAIAEAEAKAKASN